jgi:hypothetical protein
MENAQYSKYSDHERGERSVVVQNCMPVRLTGGTDFWNGIINSCHTWPGATNLPPREHRSGGYHKSHVRFNDASSKQSVFLSNILLKSDIIFFERTFGDRFSLFH